MKCLNVCVVTGTRAEFGIWRPVLQRIRASKRLRLRLIVTGMHLLKSFGNTAKDIEAAGFPIAAKVAMYRPGEPPAQSLARGIEGLAAAFRQTKADIVMVLGDRLEMLAAASAALAEQTPIAHVHGGESAPGIWDEQIRHAITKMAHVHFCSTEYAARRIRQMGESRWCIHTVGAPALDLAESYFNSRRTIANSIRGYRNRFRIAREITVLIHPEGGSDTQERRKTQFLLNSLAQLSIPCRAIGPNNDPGHRGVLQAYKNANFPVQMSLTQDEFWSQLAYTSLLIGNSSSGIIEAATFGIPVINIGGRQAGRERNANVIDVPWDRAAMARAILKATTDKSFLRSVAQKNLYGDGHASEKIVRELERLATTGIPITKQFFDK